MVLLAVVAMLAGVGLLYPDIVFEGKIFVSGDSQAAASHAAVGNKSLARGEYPVWNPYLFCGMPSFGSLSFTPWVYPINWVIKPLRAVLPLPEYTWLFVHTMVTGFGVFLLLRDRGIHAAAAIGAGVLMMWMPNLVAVGANGHGSQACAVAYLPLALLFWDRVWRGRNVVGNASALAVTLGFSMLRSHFQISYYTYALVVLHLVFFGGMALVDAARGRAASVSPLPARLGAKLRRDGTTPWGGALADTGFSSVVLAAVVGVSLLICAVLYLPVHDYAKYSIRGASETGGLDYGYATNWSLHPSEMLTFLVPFSFGFGKDLYLGHMPFTDYPNYLGVAVLAFAVVALLRVRTRWVAFLAFVTVVATLVSFGKFFPVLYDPLFKFAPYFSKFRVPVMVLIVQQLAVILLFAIGLDHVLKSDRARLRRAALRGLVVAGACFVLALLSQGYWTDGFASGAAARVRVTDDPATRLTVARMAGEFLARDLVQLAALALALAAAVFAFASSRLRPLAFASVVLVVGLVDYYRVDRYILHPERFRHHDAYRIIRDRAAVDRYLQTDPVMEFLRSREGIFRILPIDDLRNATSTASFMSNRYMVFDIASIGGYQPAKLSVYDEFLRAFAFSLQEGRLDLVHMLNARYVVTSARLPEQPSLTPVFVGDDYEGTARAIYENRDAFPRAWVVGEYAVASREQSLEALASGRVDLRRSVLLTKEPSPKPAPGDSAEVTITRWGAREAAFAVELDRPGIVVVSDAYYPDWKATVDGQPVEILQANHAFRAVALPAGRHDVVMRYDASVLERGAAISASSLAVAVLAMVFSWLAGARREKRLWWKRSS
ncbi:MAG TPA: YfhO family protein [Candidatus Krumholzibacteria bacterium]|nr:YfhO family protein [Candidatus Krumholzibacteria bacterium]